MKTLSVLVLVLALFSIVPCGNAASVFRIEAHHGDGEQALGLGVLVATELILTSSDLVSQADQVSVHHGSSGARSVADVRATDVQSGLALLVVPGLAGEPATVSKEEPKPGRSVYLHSLQDTRREGTFLSAVPDEDGRARYRFTVPVEAGEDGVPLMNNCDQLLAIGKYRTAEESDGIESTEGISGTLPDLMAFLPGNEVEIQSSTVACPSLRDQKTEAIETGRRLEEEKDVLSKEKDALADEIKELEAAIAEDQQRTEEELNALESKRRELAAELVRKDAELASKQAEAEETARLHGELEGRIRQIELELSAAREREEAATARASFLERFLIIAAVGVAIGLILIAVVVFRRRRVNHAEPQSGLQQARDVPRTTAVSGPPDGGTATAEEDSGTRNGLSVQEQAGPLAVEEPPTRIAGGFAPRPGRQETPDSVERPVDARIRSVESQRAPSLPVVGWLVIVDGPGRGTDHILSFGRNSVGRGRDARLRIDFGDTEISRTDHAVVTYDGKSNRFYLQGGTGTNLTYLDGQPVYEPTALPSGGEFIIGQTTLRFVPLCDESFNWSGDDD